MIQFLEYQGLVVKRVRGSHCFFSGALARTTVPVHGNHTLKIGTLCGILRDIDMTPQEYVEEWQQQHA